jgi:hypothetical protein
MRPLRRGNHPAAGGGVTFALYFLAALAAFGALWILWRKAKEAVR